MILIEVTFESFEGKRVAFIDLSRRISADSRREAGSVLYRFTCDTGMAMSLKRLREPSLQKLAQFRYRLELGNRIEFLEG